ncbi:unnamed protein product [Polarella glacialis]|uniref:RRM domain-containing protein n=1 Tax=Polarella glacialis TaxID=89957 RepID=A0A813FFS7_POLGL|nr:unnamed protein product [Polarella glacialis]
MAFSRGTHAWHGRRRPRGTLLLRDSLLAVALSCLHFLGTDFVAWFPSPQTARRALHEVRSLATSEASSQTLEGSEAGETRIFIAGFDSDTTEVAIREHFAKAGSIVEFKAKGKSQARLTFSSAAAAKNAVASLNGTTIAGNNRWMLVKMMDNNLKRTNVIYVSGFALGTAETTLRAHFGTAGSIVDFKFLGNRSALVTYSSNEEGISAAASLHGKSMAGADRWLAVKVEGDSKFATTNPGKAEAETARRALHEVRSLATSEASSQTLEGAEAGETRIFIAGFDSDTTEVAIREHFAKAGSIVEFKAKGKSQARLTFSSAAAAKNAVASLNGTKIAGNNRWMFVKMMDNNLKRTNVIYVSGFALGTAETTLRAHFGTAGSIVDFKFLGNRSALVTYSSNEEGKSAAASLHGKSIAGADRWLAVKVEGDSKFATTNPGKAEAVAEIKKTKKANKSKNVAALKAFPKEKTVVVWGWDSGTKLAAIQEHCGKAGSIVDSHRLSTNVFLLAYSSSEEAATAVASLNGTTIQGNSRFLSVKNYEGPGR